MKGIRTISLVDIEAAGGIDPARLVRALELTVTRIDRGRFAVAGGRAVHYVDLIDRQCERCDCADFTWRQVVCQHLLACLLREGDERVIRALCRLALRLGRDVRQLREHVRGRTIALTPSLKSRIARAARQPLNELEFHRDETGETSDVWVTARTGGHVLGRITRSVSPPESVACRAEEADDRVRAAA